MYQMKVKDLMTKNPACASADAALSKVARLMVEHNVGSIPIVEKNSNKVIGVVTDRDIATRVVAEEKDPKQIKASDIMSSPVVTVKAEDNIEDVTRLMEKNMIRRVPVVDEMGNCMGIALKTSDKTTADMVQEISKPTEKQSKVSR
jgi:CBS domain-containing protein